MNVARWIDFHARLDPERLALVELRGAPRRFTYGALQQRAGRAAGLLRDRFGVGSGDRVAVLAGNRVEQVDLFFACARLGATYVPLNWRLAAPEAAYVLRDADPKLLLVSAEHGELLAGLRELGAAGRVVPLDAEAAGLSEEAAWSGLVSQEPPPAVEPVGADTPLLLLYTSGTTGRAKGAVLTHGTLTWNAVNTQVGWGLRPDDATLGHAPLFHTGGWNVLTLPLLHLGGAVVLTPGFDPGQTLSALAEHGVTTLFAVPTMWRMLADHPDFERTDLSGLRFAVTGGAACPLPLIERWAARGVLFKQGYGLTEVGPNCFAMPDGEAISHAGSVGFPMPHLSTRIVDAEGRALHGEAEGELWLKGPTVCAGYRNRPDADAAAFREGGWFATGDLFRRDVEGRFTFVGRRKEMFVSGGENVYPAEVERVLYDLEAVAEAAVVPVPHEIWGEVGHAFVALRGPAEAEALLQACRGALARYKVPKYITVLDALPKTASGKIAKQRLQEAARA